jgi:hypothetical protein
MELSHEDLKALLFFMQRVDLKGSEVRVFTILLNKLEQMYSAPPEPKVKVKE